MIFLEDKNESFEFISLDEYKKNIEKLIKEDKYIAKKNYLISLSDNKEIYEKLMLMDKEAVLQSWCKNQRTNYKQLKSLMNFYGNTEELIKYYNEDYVMRHLITEKEYLDTVLLKDDPNIKLDEDQRKVVLSNEDYTLVIAGAGAGKTTTIEAKVKYLIDRQNVNPSKILIISFTKKATKELQERCSKLGLPVRISTFHSLANAIIARQEEEHHKIATGDIMFSSIKKFLLNNSNDEVFVKKILLFFASYLEVPIDENNIAVLFNELNKNDYTTLKSDITDVLDKYKKQQEKKHITIKNEKVRSIEECRIANFLFINGIDYEYEPVYKYCFNGTTKPYCPDFLINQYGKQIYLEHFGISEDGKNSRFSEDELNNYKKHIKSKILLHREHNTNLIYTFSKYNDSRSVLVHLKEILKKNGISLEPKNSKEIYNAIIANAEDKYFNKLLQLICVFISRFKTNNYTASKFNEWKISLTDERTKLFVDICHQCYLAYMAELKNTKSIDFEDMINNAANILDKMIEDGEKLPYDYIFVDEYQDISLQRFDLCEKLSKCSEAKIVAVGDDWQSIFRFSGAKIELFTKFEQLMGYADIKKITKTYRNSQELIDIAGNFVMENEAQVKKNLKSSKSEKNPITLVSYDDSYQKDEKGHGPGARFVEALEKSIDMLVNEYGESQKLLLIGRYGFEGYNLSRLNNELFVFERDGLKVTKYPELKISYLTAHSSKGLGYDNVIIINAKDAVLGFPSKIEDDPVMKLVIKDDESYDYAEERRLFYVALTRTKNKVHIITPKYKPSQFVLELKEKYQNVILDGGELEPIKEISNVLKCPYCGYPMQKRNNKNFKIKGNLWICSNEPEVCGFITNDMSGGRLCISKCPKCEDGYLIVKTAKNKNNKIQKMLGCSNFKSDGSGCNTYVMEYNYTQDIEELNIRFYDENTDINNVKICGYSLKEMVNIILNVVNTYKNTNILMSPKLLFSLLSGEKTKQIETFKMYNNKYYSTISAKDKRKLFLLFSAMQDAKIVIVDENNYGRITILKETLDDNDYKIIYASIKLN